MTRPVLYQALASLLDARATCQSRADAAQDRDQIDHWWRMFDMHNESIAAIMKSAPSGSGIDNGTLFAAYVSASESVFHTSFHHMNENGFYDGWTEHKITVRPSLQFGVTIKISGRNRNEIKDYLHDVFHTWLTTEV